MQKKMTGPRCPVGEEEAFAWGFMVGYLGTAPSTMESAFFTVAEIGSNAPAFLNDYQLDAQAWKRGYDCGVATYTDHAYPQDREA